MNPNTESAEGAKSAESRMSAAEHRTIQPNVLAYSLKIL